MIERVFKLKDPDIKAYNIGRKDFYRSRADAILKNEKLSISVSEIDALSNAARRFEAGDYPSHIPMIERGLREISNRARSDTKRISNAANNLVAAIDECAMATKLSIIEKLAAKGITPDKANHIINTLCEVAEEMKIRPIQQTKQGNTQKLRAAWAIEIWQRLQSKCGMRKASRVIAYILDGDYADEEGVYQVIRNKEIGK